MDLLRHGLLFQWYPHKSHDLLRTVALCVRHSFCREFYVLSLCAQGGGMAESSPIKWAVVWYALLDDTTHRLR